MEIEIYHLDKRKDFEFVKYGTYRIKFFKEAYPRSFYNCLLIVKIITPRKWKQKTKSYIHQTMYEIMLFHNIDVNFRRPLLEKLYSHFYVDKVNLDRIKKVLNILHIIDQQKIEINTK